MDISFSSGDEVSDEQKGGNDSSVLHQHSFSLSLRSAAPAACVLDTAKCTFDVAHENMVVILMKKTVGIWAEGASPTDKLLQGAVPEASPSSPIPKASPADIAASVKDMKLADSSAAALYELD